MSTRIPWSWIQRHTAGVVRQGLDLDTLLADFMIELRHGDERDFISPAQWVLLCMNTSLGIEDSAHGLAETTINPTYPAIGLRMMMGSPSLHSAIDALAKLYLLSSSAVKIRLDVAGDVAELSVHATATRLQDEIHLEETYLVWIFMHCLYYTNRRMPILSVTTRDPTHFALGRQHIGIGAPLRLGRRTAFRFARALLPLCSPTAAGENIYWESERLWLQHVGTDFAAQISAAPMKPASLETMARSAGLSVSTVRRRLHMTKGGFRHDRERTLVRFALDRLRSTTDSVDAIAVELGYADARSFRRFVKAATGRTPSELRGAHDMRDDDLDVAIANRLRQLGASIRI